MSGKAILRAMHVGVAEGRGILLTNSQGWDFMSEIGLARAGSNEASRQNNKSDAWFYCFYQKFYFFRSDSLTHWLMTHDSLTHLTHKTSVLQNTAYFAFFPDFLAFIQWLRPLFQGSLSPSQVLPSCNACCLPIPIKILEKNNVLTQHSVNAYTKLKPLRAKQSLYESCGGPY